MKLCWSAVLLTIVALVASGCQSTPQLLVTGIVWHDENKDGIRQEDEKRIANATVRLTRSGGDEPLTTTTDPLGIYTFNSSPTNRDNAHFVQVVPPPGFAFTRRDAGADHLDSDVDPQTGRTDGFSLQEKTALDAGLLKTQVTDQVSQEEKSPTPTSTSTPTNTPTPTATATPTDTATPTLPPTPTFTPTPTAILPPDLTPPVPAQIPIGSATGSIFYSSLKDGNWELYSGVVKSQTLASGKSVTPTSLITFTQITRWTYDPAVDDHPTFRNQDDGFYYASTLDGSVNIHQLDWNGQSKQITKELADSYVYYVLKNGKLLTINNSTGNGQIVVLNTDGTEANRVTNDQFNYACPIFTPDGKIIALRNEQGGSKLYTLDENGDSLQKLTPDNAPEGCARVSADGNKLVYAAFYNNNWDIYLRDLLTGSQVRLTDDPAVDTDGDISPDRIWVAFTRWGGDNSNLFVLNISTRQTFQLTNDSADAATPRWYTGSQNLTGSVIVPSDVPVGKSIAVVDSPKDTTLCSTTTRTSNPAADVRSIHVSQSPGSDKLLFEVIFDGSLAQAQNPALRLSLRGANDARKNFLYQKQGDQLFVGEIDANNAFTADSKSGTRASDGTFTTPLGLVIVPSKNNIVAFTIPKTLQPPDLAQFAVSARAVEGGQQICDTAGPYKVPSILR